MDAFGQAALDFLETTHDEFIHVTSKTMEDDVIPVAHLFRTFDEMPICEQIILQQVKGKTLDVGGGVGSHSLYLQNNGYDSTLIDISQGLCDVSTKRGVQSVIMGNYYDYHFTEKFDNLIFMMNGIGLDGSFNSLTKTITRARELLNSGGKLYFDSTDISFCYEQEDGSVILPLNMEYHGFVEFQLEYKNKKDDPFKWAYFDFEKMKELLPDHLTIELLHEEGPAYAAVITGF